MIYTMPSEAAGIEILEALGRRYPSKHDDSSADKLVYHETFDWRLHRAGGFLISAPSPLGRRLFGRAASDTGVRRVDVDAVPAFAVDFPPGAFREELEPILEMRRLLPIVEVENRGRTLHVMDDEEKTVVRVELRHSTARRPGGDRRRPLPVTLRTVPLRGYDREHEELVRVLESDHGLEPAVGGGIEQLDLARALAAIGREPLDYTSKQPFRLEPSRRSDETLVEICRTLLETLLANEDGVRRDLDSEFLHDFRVAVRRARSALTQLKGVFPSPETELLRKELKWLGNATGPTRDLDVYLLKIPGYEASLPESVRADLKPLRDFLERRQRREHARLVAELDSGRYRDLIRTWSRFVDEPPAGSAAHAGRPIGELASERIWRAYRRVLKKGGAITPETPAEALHRLRIDCKKLRYLLEFFRSLYPSREAGALIKALKRLQDNLGDFNDLEVQQLKLRDFAGQIQAEGGASSATLLAMGQLVGGLGRLQEEERLAFAERFARFNRRKNRKVFLSLFGPSPG